MTPALVILVISAIPAVLLIGLTVAATRAHDKRFERTAVVSALWIAFALGLTVLFSRADRLAYPIYADLFYSQPAPTAAVSAEPVERQITPAMLSAREKLEIMRRADAGNPDAKRELERIMEEAKQRKVTK